MSKWIVSQNHLIINLNQVCGIYWEKWKREYVLYAQSTADVDDTWEICTVDGEEAAKEIIEKIIMFIKSDVEVLRFDG